ncbi:MAG: molybdopterin-binding protein [Pseudorhodoplanes sp.]|uniref:molybdopterin-binding protein n=1 Tax=Pseudorhodoplanes sp. TaxID=1934341 RepID=UPI003D1021C7
MNAERASCQRIGRLTPLADVLAAIARIEPVAPREVAPAAAAACVLAADVNAPESRPAAPLALRDGWAVDADATRDAGPYAPLTLQPPPQRVDAFAALPSGTDAVAPLDAASALGGMMQFMTPAAPGEAVLPSGGDIEANAVLYREGARLRASDVAVLSAAGFAAVGIRQPSILIVNTRRDDALLGPAATMLARAVTAAGATCDITNDLDAGLDRNHTDAIIVIGGTGEGRNDRSVMTLSRVGTVACHGIGLAPGDTAAFGMANGKPVLLMPGRIDAVLACWLVLGRALLDRLSGARDIEIVSKATLARKVTSSIGIAEVIPLRRAGEQVEPLASGYLSLQSLARADGWMLVPAECEGYPAGAEIEMRPLP